MYKIERIELKSEINEKNKIDAAYGEIKKITNDTVGSNIVSALTNPNIRKYQTEVEEILKKYGFNFKAFYATLFNRLAIYKKFPLYIYNSGLFINEAKREENKLILDTKDGIYEALEAIGTLPLTNVSVDALNNNCHTVSQELTEILGYNIETAFCRGMFNNQYIHTFNRTETNLIIDGSNNLIFSEDTFNELYAPTSIVQMTRNEFIADPLYHRTPNNLPAPLLMARKKGESKRF